MKHSDVGASAFVRGSIPLVVREEHDFHQTPPIGTKLLLSKEKFPGTIWEPACGKGMMSEVLKSACRRVISTDLVDRGYGEIVNFDFLRDDPPKRFKFDYVVTNPPYTHTLAFAQRALSYQPKKVAMLARLAWLEGKTRKVFFETSGLSRVWVFTTRLNMPRESRRKEFKETGGMVAYAWYVWERGHAGPPTLGWL